MSKINIELTEDQILGLSIGGYNLTKVETVSVMEDCEPLDTLLTPELELILEELEKEKICGMYAQAHPRVIGYFDNNFKERVLYDYETKLEALFACNFFNKKGFLAVGIWYKEETYGVIVNTLSFWDR